MATSITVSGEGLTLDTLLWRRYGQRGRTLVAETLAANPGLAALGPILPPGTTITIPDLPPASATMVKVVTLFG